MTHCCRFKHSAPRLYNDRIAQRQPMTSNNNGDIEIEVPNGKLRAEGTPPGTEVDGSQGIFEIRNACDLFAKLKRDFDAFGGEPWNSDLAFNFFVTGWSLLEWSYPDDKEKRESIRNDSVPLQVCHHIATGAKHFEPRDSVHDSVVATGRRKALERLTGKWEPGVWADGVWNDSLTISLSPAAEDYFGSPKVAAIRVANEVLEFWQSHLR